MLAELCTGAFLTALAPLCAGAAAVVTAGRRRCAAPDRTLLFHALSTQRLPHVSWVHRDTFARFCARLAGSGLPVSTVSALRGRTGSSGMPVCLCFDDGFEDFHRYAMPALHASMVKATVFPVTGFIGGTGGGDAFAPRRRMDAAQLREISSLGYEIGSHTHSHPDLSRLPDRLLDDELRRSRAVIEELTGAACTAVSFPYGSCTPRVWEHARTAGYTTGVVYGGGPAAPGLHPAAGAYAFDTVDDLWARITGGTAPSIAVARSRVMPHFARGTPLWKFRAHYLVPGR